MLGLADHGAFHRALHGARTAAGADVEPAQAEFVTDLLGVVVLLASDRVPAPADHQGGGDVGAQGAAIAQDVEDHVGHAVAAVQVEAAAAVNFVVDVDQVANHREQVFADTLDDLAVDKGAGRRVLQLQLHAALLLNHADVEIGMLGEHRETVIDVAARVEHGQRTAPEQVVETVLAAVEQARDLQHREYVEVVFGSDSNRANGVCHRPCL